MTEKKQGGSKSLRRNYSKPVDGDDDPPSAERSAHNGRARVHEVSWCT